MTVPTKPKAHAPPVLSGSPPASYALWGGKPEPAAEPATCPKHPYMLLPCAFCEDR